MGTGRIKLRENGGFVANRYRYTSLTFERNLEICQYSLQMGIQNALNIYYPDVTSTQRESKRKQIIQWIKRVTTATRDQQQRP